MLELRKISKVYETDGLKQRALDGVSISFRRNDFTSILGPSGSGKTTMLNIIGGLDQYTSGDLVIDGVSTKEYGDRDWDTYRNDRVGFVFQSYNLIGHQSILANVELALTLSGVSSAARKRRAKAALVKVGLKDHMHKRPNQLSGGQMQRVAIARALVNDPDIMLADEPTGALDSTTSAQVMGILKEISKEKLVIMVTHNEELAEEYSTRIIKVRDGKVTGDTRPYKAKEVKRDAEALSGKTRRTSMGLGTALGLSLNNLMTKKGRTILTAFAGSIGIIGIAMILALSNGVQEYIARVQTETLSSYPISVEANSVDISSMMSSVQSYMENDVECEEGMVCTVDDVSISPYLSMQSSMVSNNLEEFKKFLDENGGGISDYVTDIQYGYGLDLQIYSADIDGGAVRVNPNTFSLMGGSGSSGAGMLGASPESGGGNVMGSSMSALGLTTDVFSELIDSEELLASQYEVLSGRMPERYDELVLVVDDDGTVPISVMYSLDLAERGEVTELMKRASEGEKVSLESVSYSYDDLLSTRFKLVLNTDYFAKSGGNWVDKSKDAAFLNDVVKKGTDVKIVGVAKVSDDAVAAQSGFVGYTRDLTEYVIGKVSETAIAKEQLADENVDVFTGMKFDGFATSLDANMATLGIADLEKPSSINIYPKDFEAKEAIEDIIAEYNDGRADEDKISYTDLVGTLMSGIVSIIDIITYVLVAFVAISLVVSSIMIAIITYISVLERTKEIGILRAIGASKKDISRVFNAETIIEGFIAGIMGVGITYLLCVPANMIIESLFDVRQIASLPIQYALILILISVVLTVVAGLIPARMASKRDPVEALRSE